MKLEEVFRLKEEVTEDVKTETTGSHSVGEFDPFGNRGDVQFGPSSGGSSS